MVFANTRRHEPADRVNLICQLLNDVNPNLRRSAADSLIRLARDAGLKETVIEENGKGAGGMIGGPASRLASC